MLPNTITLCVDAWASVERIQTYLLQPELDPHAVQQLADPGKARKGSDDEPPVVVRIQNGDFKYDPAKASTLSNINLEVITIPIVVCVCGYKVG